MNLYLDTEFIEGFHKPYFGKKRHFIDLISIGLVDDTGRSYYAISKDFNPSDADEWVKENVLKPIVKEFMQPKRVTEDWFKYAERKMFEDLERKSLVGQINFIQNQIGRTNKQIAKEVAEFVYKPTEPFLDVLANDDGTQDVAVNIWLSKGNTIDFYGYYADYDWVLLCSLFGRMIDLPAGFPMYCNDLKQLMVEKGLTDEWKQATCPDPVGIHNSIVDANWNLMLHKAILTVNATSL